MTADHHPLTDVLDTLDRDELLQFVHYHLGRLQTLPVSGLLPTERDVVAARWHVACSRANTAHLKVAAAYEDIRPLAETVDATRKAWAEATEGGALTTAAKRLRKYDRALDAFQAADSARRRLEARADSLQRQADRLFDKWQAMKV